jgi:TPR repeat protein
LANAQHGLGICYARGTGVAQDDAEVVRLFRLAVEQGVGGATVQYVLGYYYENGIGVDQDHAEALHWYRQAADCGHALAQDGVARLSL